MEYKLAAANQYNKTYKIKAFTSPMNETYKIKAFTSPMNETYKIKAFTSRCVEFLLSVGCYGIQSTVGCQ